MSPDSTTHQPADRPDGSAPPGRCDNMSHPLSQVVVGARRFGLAWTDADVRGRRKRWSFTANEMVVGEVRLPACPYGGADAEFVGATARVCNERHQ